MAGLRVFSPITADVKELVLDPAESHHLVRVRRARVGDRVEAISGNGFRATTQVLRADGRAAVLKVAEIERAPLPGWNLTLAQALPKGKTMDAVIQRATELGVDRIVPLFSRNSEVELDQRRGEQKRQKWEQTALESLKQCGNPWLPDIASPVSLSTFLGSLNSGSCQLVAALTPEAQPLRSVWPQHEETHEVVLLVGPEGDFSPEEYAEIFAARFRPVSLGPRVLRVETAACALLALSLDLLRERF